MLITGKQAGLASAICALGTIITANTVQAAPPQVSPHAAAVFAFWTPERQAKAIPRDLVVDSRGLGYLRKADGKLQPYGHHIAALAKDVATRKGKPGGGGGGGGGGGRTKVVSSSTWDVSGAAQNAIGRILFQMPDGYYVCSGTVVNDGTSGRSVILTAGHCVYDDVAKTFATNVLFIPNQDETTGTGTDFDCNNDPLGCWAPSFGVVGTDWTTATFPNNIPYDYAYYVVNDTGAHSGAGSNVGLDSAASPLDISFTAATLSVKTTALGYSYDVDPLLMYCQQDVGLEGSYGDYWLSRCGLSGGSSGGPWTQSTAADLGTGPVMSVNSWGYTGQPGMAGPPLHGNFASCLFDQAKASSLNGGDVIGCN